MFLSTRRKPWGRSASCNLGAKVPAVCPHPFREGDRGRRKGSGVAYTDEYPHACGKNWEQPRTTRTWVSTGKQAAWAIRVGRSRGADGSISRSGEGPGAAPEKARERGRSGA